MLYVPLTATHPIPATGEHFSIRVFSHLIATSIQSPLGRLAGLDVSLCLWTQPRGPAVLTLCRARCPAINNNAVSTKS